GPPYRRSGPGGPVKVPRIVPDRRGEVNETTASRGPQTRAAQCVSRGAAPSDQPGGCEVSRRPGGGRSKRQLAQIGAELVREIGTGEREFHHRLEEADLLADVVPLALELD